MEKKRVTVKDYTEEYFERLVQFWKDSSVEARETANEILSVIKPSGRDVIADIGCGPGIYTIECAKRGSYIYAIDFSRIVLNMAKKLSREFNVFDSIAFINATTEAIALNDSSVNKAICIDVVEHLYPEQFDLLLTELFRITKNNGIVIIYTPSPGFITHLPNPVKRLGSKILRMPQTKSGKVVQKSRKYEYLHVNLKSARSIRRQLKRKGFIIDKAIHTRTGFQSLETMPVLQDFLGGHTLIIARVKK